MKKDNEFLLKYLADTLDENEKNIFENELAGSSELKNRLVRLKNQIGDLKVDTEILDERYFSNLLPKVHQRLEKKEKQRFAEKIHYLVPYLAAAIVGLLFLFKPTYNFDHEYKDLARKVVNNMTDQDVASKYFDELDSEPVVLETAGEENSLASLVPSNVDVNGESATRILNGTALDEYGTFYGYTEDQLQTIASNLEELNIK